MANTTYQDVLTAFESSFQDKYVLPPELIYEWFLKAVAFYCLEIREINFDAAASEFDVQLPAIVVALLADIMKIRYQERELSRVNKMNNIVSKDISLNSTGDAKKATQAELNYLTASVNVTAHKLKNNAFF